MGLVERIRRQIWGLVELIFLTNCTLSERILTPNFRLSELNFSRFSGLGTYEKIPNFGIYGGKFETFVIFG